MEQIANDAFCYVKLFSFESTLKLQITHSLTVVKSVLRGWEHFGVQL